MFYLYNLGLSGNLGVEKIVDMQDCLISKSEFQFAICRVTQTDNIAVTQIKEDLKSKNEMHKFQNLFV